MSLKTRVEALATRIAAEFKALRASKLDASAYTAADVLTKIKTVDGSGSGLDADLLDGKHASEFSASCYSVNQAAHGFTVGTPVKPSPTGWVKTKADTRQNAGTVAFVSEVVDAANFKYIESGSLPGVYTAGAVYFLSPTVAGSIIAQTDPEVWSEGQVREVVGTANTAGTALIVSLEVGQVITSVLFTQNIVQSGSVTGKVITIKQSNAPDVTITLPDYQPLSTILSQIAALTTGTGLLRKTTGGWVLDTSSGWNNSVQVLSGANPTFDPANGLHARLAPTGVTTLTFANLIAGQSGNFTVQNPVSVYEIVCVGYTFDISQAVLAHGDMLTSSGNSKKDRYSWYFDGVSVSINGQLDYK